MQPRVCLAGSAPRPPGCERRPSEFETGRLGGGDLWFVPCRLEFSCFPAGSCNGLYGSAALAGRALCRSFSAVLLEQPLLRVGFLVLWLFLPSRFGVCLASCWKLQGVNGSGALADRAYRCASTFPSPLRRRRWCSKPPSGAYVTAL